MAGILDGFSTDQRVPIDGAEFIPDAYAALEASAAEGKITLRRYADNSEKKLAWIHQMIQTEYAGAKGHPEYRAFLCAKFPFLTIP